MVSVQQPGGAAVQGAVGPRIRELRKRRGLTVRELGTLLGISGSAVSQIEREVMRPSVSRLIEIANALGTPLAALFDDEGEPNPDSGHFDRLPSGGFTLRRAEQSRPVTLAGGVQFRRLSPSSVAGLDFFESLYPPGATATLDDELFRHEGYETGTVTEGELTIEFERERVVLGRGDSIGYPCETSHRIINRSSERAVAVWLILHP
ncbi:helix-turn-helix domain-containing protein [Glycomyces buryatensis]|uniref:Helix-turn-helix domain-containing protein n=1 Tax=Glycomyces buryatensis TaxID=2570927 RepID=A0A4S8QF04_9ACTN|nr:helix-turn-helix domain-containing protein [Glycomyces buryatensis]THV43237.1 helix-turn-helix domain-containing protein [Glycomyces buryatensis]